MKVIAKNKKAYFDYEILEKYLAGMVLRGWEVKSIKAGNVTLRQAYCYEQAGEVFVKNLQIGVWPGAQDEAEKSSDEHKLLLHSKEIDAIHRQLQTKGLTIVPLALGLQRNYLKLEIGVARGKKKYDKRAKIKEKEMKRNIKRELKSAKYF